MAEFWVIFEQRHAGLGQNEGPLTIGVASNVMEAPLKTCKLAKITNAETVESAIKCIKETYPGAANSKAIAVEVAKVTEE